MPLSDAAIRRIEPRTKPFKIADSLGLYMLVQTSGSRLWRMNYTFAGRQKTLALGVYPTVSLSEARDARDAAKRQLRLKQDPGAVVKAEKVAEKLAVANSFRAVAAQWLKRKVIAEHKAKSTVERAQWLIDILNEGIGDKLISEIEAPDLLAVLRRLEARDKLETVKRLRATASNIFRFGIASGACKRDPAEDLKGALTSGKSTPRSAIVDPADVGKLLRDIDGYHKPVLRLALQLLALVFTRPGNICSAEWSEFDEASGVWNIPGPKMKMREFFRVPLSKQALTVLQELRKHTGNSRFLFPSRMRGKTISPNKLNVALRRLGYSADEVSAHGFRSTASTLLNEFSRFSPDVIELALAHKPGGVRALYNRSKYWKERCKLAQWYADYLDGLRGRGKVVKLPWRKPAARQKAA